LSSALWSLLLGAVIGGVVVGVVSAKRFSRPATDARIDEVVDQPHEIQSDNIENLKAIFDALPIGVVIADAAGIVLLRNKLAVGVGGLRHVDVLVDEAVERLIAAFHRNGQAVREVLELFGPPQKTLVIDVRPLDDNRSLTVIEDISERSRIDAVRTDFVANISHELKTPVGALSILAETIQDEDDLAVIHKLSQRMVKEAYRMAQTIDDLLELSRIELDGSVQPEEVSVVDVIRESVERLSHVVSQLGIQLVAEIPETDAVVMGDRVQLVSAVSNLIDNAAKYSEKGDTIIVKAEKVGEKVEISVIDEGIGIPQVDLDRIFERFYRVDRARSRGTGGTGLGLSIVRHVASNYGGTVNVKSQEGEGSTFVLTFPAS
jgi:two-component system sensor histidine kinase SenX3